MKLYLCRYACTGLIIECVSSDATIIDSDDRWNVRFFGAFRAERKGTVVSFRTRKTAGLLAYLAFHTGKPIAKDLLVETFWPESNATQGRQSLRMALSALRASLATEGWDPDIYLQSDREVVELSERGITTDVRDFLAGIESAKSLSGLARIEQMTEALYLWTGAFLDGANEHWITPQALELEEHFANTLGSLSVALCDQGSSNKAAEWARKGLSYFPMREDLHVNLMRVYAASGNNSMVLKQFEDLEQMLEDNWGEMPGEEAMSLIETLPRRERPAVTETDLKSPEVNRPARKSFFGRDKELGELLTLLAPNHEPKLINLIGLGGSGKTRLAQRATENQSEVYAGQTWFVSLIGVESGEQAWGAIAAEIGLPTGQGLAERIAEKLGGRPALLALDNLEHLVEDCTAIVSELMAACPNLKVLATSRVPLNLSGERLYPVLPLPLPTDYRDLPALRTSPSVELLTDAAQAVRPGFSVTPANAQSVLLLVQRMDGIPLAIELAAAKLGTLTPAQVIASLARRIDIETSRPLVREQHRSLRIIIEWSLGLLTDVDRRAFAVLGVCRGGFDISLAVALLGPDAEAIVERLSRCSLITWSEAADELRFSMLETVREMAIHLLDEDAKLHREATEQHLNHLLSITNSDLRKSDVAQWVIKVSNDAGNLLAAIEAASNGMVAPESAWQLTLPLSEYLDRRGGPQMWVAPLESLSNATLEDLKPALAAQAHMLMAETYYGTRNIKATFIQYQLAQKAADESGDRVLRIASRTDSVSSAITQGDFQFAQRVLEEAIALLPADGDDESAAMCHLNLAWVVFDRGDEDAAVAGFETALKFAQRAEDNTIVASALVGLACSIGNSDYAMAQPHFEEAKYLWIEAKLPARLAHCYYNRALIDYRHGQGARSLSNIETSLRLYVECGVALGQSALTIAGTVFAANSDFPRAATCWGRAERARRRHQMAMIPFLAKDYDRELPRVNAGLSPKDLTIAWSSSDIQTDQEFVERLFGPKA